MVAIAATLLVVAACGPNAATTAPTPAATDAPAVATEAPAASEEAPSTAITLPDGPVTLRVAYYNAGGQTEIDYRQAQAEAFMQAHPNVTVKMEPVADWGETLYPQLAAGTAADVLWADTDTGYGQMVAKGAYTSLQPFVDAEGFDLSKWPEGMIKHFSGADGGLLLLPNSNLSFNFLYYNKDLFDKAGVAYPTADWTLDDLIAAARKLSAKGEQWGFGFAWDDLYLTWMRMYGCEFADDGTNPTQYTYNTPECVKAIAELDKLSREGIINWELGAKWGGLAPGDSTGERAFSNGDVAMLLSGTWEAPSIVTDSEGAFQFDAAPAPMAPEGTIQGAASGFGVYANSQNPEWAWEYVKYLAGPEGQAADAGVGLGQSPIAEILDQVYCKSDAPPANKCEVAKVGAEATQWEPNTEKWGPGFWDVIGPAVQAGFTADTPPDWQKLLDEAVATSQQAAPLP
jgi:multiple sugar transport system substrate-binding protein